MPDVSFISGTIESRPSQKPGLTTPTIAIVIVARDAADHLAEAFTSILDQTRAPDEVVFFNDASTDESLSIAEGFQDRLPNLTILSSSETVGISKARNQANASVTSEYIAVLDADDLLAPEALAHFYTALEENPEAGLLYADTCVFSESPTQGKVLHYPSFETSGAGIRATLGAPRLPMKHSSFLYKRCTFEDLGGYDESLPIKVDVDLFLRFLHRDCPVVKLDAVTSYHRKHLGQISRKRLTGLRIYSQLASRYEPNPFIRTLLILSRTFAEVGKLFLRG
ncbi:MAG: glycosyltransferase family A protein [Verrucomicrobiota bacterium]